MNPDSWLKAWKSYANMFADKHQKNIGRPHKRQKPNREHREHKSATAKAIRRMITKSRTQAKRNKKSHKPMRKKG